MEAESITKTSASNNQNEKLYLIEYMSQTGSYYKTVINILGQTEYTIF